MWEVVTSDFTIKALFKGKKYECTTTCIGVEKCNSSAWFSLISSSSFGDVAFSFSLVNFVDGSCPGTRVAIQRCNRVTNGCDVLLHAQSGCVMSEVSDHDVSQDHTDSDTHTHAHAHTHAVL